VFCGSKPGDRSTYLTAARELGELLAGNDLGLFYGGAPSGLMGAVADAVLAGEAGVRLGQMSEFSLLLVAVAVQAQTISHQAAHLVQVATLITFVVSSTFVVLRYPSPIALSEHLRRD